MPRKNVYNTLSDRKYGRYHGLLSKDKQLNAANKENHEPMARNKLGDHYNGLTAGKKNQQSLENLYKKDIKESNLQNPLEFRKRVAASNLNSTQFI